MDSDEYYSDYSEHDSEVEDFEDFLEDFQHVSVAEDTKQEVENTPTYIQLSQQDILTSMNGEIEKVTCICDNVTSTEARFLLMSCKWDVNLVLGPLFDGEKRKEKLYKKAGIEMKDPLNEDDAPTFRADEDEVECEICLDDFAVKDTVSLGCRHVFCTECLEASLSEDVNNQKLKICCPGEDCKNLIASDFILKLLKNEKSCSSYTRLLTQSYIDSKPEISWCPGTDCNLALKLVILNDDYKVECSNGHKSCFKCQQPWHDPLDCKMLKKWSKRSKNHDPTTNWITAFTKECPKCAVTTQKDGGCNYIQCNRCHAEWCWVCLGHHDHNLGAHKCSTNVPKNISEERAEMERYVIYHDR